ncbi:MAG: 50S ribosomal protein L23 [Pseudomonadota bacterium]
MKKLAGNVIKRPLLTEKGTALSEGANMVLFEVDTKANKVEIRSAIEELYNVKVVSVRTQIVRGKFKRVRQSAGLRPKWKKAIVELAEGSSIDFFAVG